MATNDIVTFVQKLFTAEYLSEFFFFLPSSVLLFAVTLFVALVVIAVKRIFF